MPAPHRPRLLGPLFLSVAILALVGFLFRERLITWVHDVREGQRLERESTKLGATKPVEAIDDYEVVNKVMEEVVRTWTPGATLPPELAGKLESYMRPPHPTESRARAMRAGQVIGPERWRKVLLEAWTDKDPRIRRVAVAKADTDLDLWPDMVPSLADDPDPGVHSAWINWMQTIEFRQRTGRDPSTGSSVKPHPLPPAGPAPRTP